MSGGIVGHNFNPRLREGGDGTAWDNNYYIPISIHASEKEATRDSIRFLVSQYNFNPRLREGGDQRLPLPLSPSSPISIHASEKEATSLSMSPDNSTSWFQSTPPRRRRHKGGVSGEWLLCISIHASEKEATATYCDTSTIMYISSLNNFFVRYF